MVAGHMPDFSWDQADTELSPGHLLVICNITLKCDNPVMFMNVYFSKINR